jgi:hypothetical protein
MKRQLTGALRRSILLVASVAASATLAVGFAGPAAAYGCGAGHDVWQVGISGNCNNPSFCGADGLGGFGGGSSSTGSPMGRSPVMRSSPAAATSLAAVAAVLVMRT